MATATKSAALRKALKISRLAGCSWLELLRTLNWSTSLARRDGNGGGLGRLMVSGGIILTSSKDRFEPETCKIGKCRMV